MPILTEQEIVASLKMEKYGHFGIQLSKHFMSWLRISDINNIYDRYAHLQGLDFINAVLNHLNIEVVLSENDIKRIPRKEHPIMRPANFLTASNVSRIVADLPIEKQYARYGTPIKLTTDITNINILIMR